MDPKGLGTVSVELNRNTAAQLLARLCVELGTEDATVTGVLSRSLGLLDLAQQTKRRGGRLCFVNERGETVGRGVLDESKDRPRLPSLSPDHSRQDQREPAQVHQPRRDDRSQRQRDGFHSDCRSVEHPPVQATAVKSNRAGWARGTARLATRSGNGQEQPGGAGEAGDRPGDHLLEVDADARRARRDPRRGARSCRASSQREPKSIVTHKDRYTGNSLDGTRVAASHFRRTYKEALKRQICQRHLRSRTIRSSSQSATTSVIARGRQSLSRTRTQSSST